VVAILLLPAILGDPQLAVAVAVGGENFMNPAHAANVERAVPAIGMHGDGVEGVAAAEFVQALDIRGVAFPARAVEAADGDLAIGVA
jgi:hypothetical protein